MRIKIQNWIIQIYADHIPPHCHLEWKNNVCKINLETWEVIEGKAPKGWKKILKNYRSKKGKDLLTLAKEKLKP